MENEMVQLDKKEMETLLVNITGQAIDAKIKELGLDKVDRKFGNFPGSVVGMSDEDVKNMDKKEKVAKFIKAIALKDTASLAVFKAMSGGTGSAGGFLVPEEFRTDVMRVVEDFGLIAKMATKIPMKSDTMNQPRLGSSVSVGYPGENTAGTASQIVLEQVQLLAKSLVGITPMSNELLEDADANIVDLLTQLFAEAIAGEMDNQGFNGTGSPFTGILGDSGVTVVTAASGADTFDEATTADYARQLIAQIKPWALQGAAFFMNKGRWSVLQQTKASSGGEYFGSAVNPVLSIAATQGMPNAQAGTLWGYPVYLTDKLTNTTAVSTKFMVFGNLKHVLLGDRKQMAVAISQDATVGSDNLFAANMSAVRVVDRHALAVGLPTAFAVLKTAAS